MQMHAPMIVNAVSICLFADDDDELLLLIQRGKEPFAGHWSLPGGSAEEGEDMLQAAHRELFEETGLQVGELIFVHKVQAERYLLHVFTGSASIQNGRASGDASAIRCVRSDEIAGLVTTPNLMNSVSLAASVRKTAISRR